MTETASNPESFDDRSALIDEQWKPSLEAYPCSNLDIPTSQAILGLLDYCNVLLYTPTDSMLLASKAMEQYLSDFPKSDSDDEDDLED